MRAWAWWLGMVACACWHAQPGAAQIALQGVETLGDATETTCVASGDRALWIGTLGAGVFRVSGGGAPERFDSERGLGGNRVRDCVLLDGAPWVATDDGLSRFDPVARGFTLIAQGRFLKLASAAGVVLAARGDGVVERHDAHGGRSPGVQLPAVAAALALRDDGERFAVGAMDGALYVVTGQAVRRVPLPESPGGAREPIERLAFAGGVLHAGTASHAYEVDAALRVKTLSAAHGDDDDPALRGALVHARARHGGAEVIATDRGAFLRASPGAPLAKVALPSMPCGDRISALAAQGDVLWIGSFDRGLCRLDAHGVTRFAGPAYLPSDMINALAGDERTLYVATDAGLVTVDAAGTFTQLTHQQCIGKLAGRCPWHAAVNGVAVDPSTGAVWVADIAALHRIDPATGQWTHPGTRAVLGSQAVTRVAAQGGLVAIGTSDRGVLLWSEQTGRTRVLDDQHGLADNWVTDLAFDSAGRLWIASCTRGLSVRERDGRIRSFDRNSGPSDDYLFSVQEVGGLIWVGSASGATVLDGRRPIAFDTRHGLAGSEVHDVVLYRGHVWLATDGGLSVVDVLHIPSPGG